MIKEVIRKEKRKRGRKEKEIVCRKEGEEVRRVRKGREKR